jgi:hypothetical protein
LTIRGISTNRILEITLAALENTILSSVGHVVVTADEIKAVFAVIWGSDAIETSLEAEYARTNKASETILIFKSSNREKNGRNNTYSS